jgi:putative transposase
VVNIVNHDKGAKILLAGIETMRMIRKGRLDSTKGQVASTANQFYSLAF